MDAKMIKCHYLVQLHCRIYLDILPLNQYTKKSIHKITKGDLIFMEEDLRK